MTVLTAKLNYSEEIAPLYNSEFINNACEDIDDGHPQSKALKEMVLSGISTYDFPEGNEAIKKVKADLGIQ